MVLNKVVEGKGNFGYNAQTGEYGDLMEMGVVDPTKVARCALQNAASVAGLILTTDAMVAELPKEESAGGGMGGGMGGWHGRHGWHGHVTSAQAPAVHRHSGRDPGSSSKKKPRLRGAFLRTGWYPERWARAPGAVLTGPYQPGESAPLHPEVLQNIPLRERPATLGCEPVSPSTAGAMKFPVSGRPRPAGRQKGRRMPIPTVPRPKRFRPRAPAMFAGNRKIVFRSVES